MSTSAVRVSPIAPTRRPSTPTFEPSSFRPLVEKPVESIGKLHIFRCTHGQFSKQAECYRVRKNPHHTCPEGSLVGEFKTLPAAIQCALEGGE